ncbi:Thiol-disulfide oxidoreductase ResA [Flavobacterium sp. ACN2]|jgi:peroxiredoxin|uniref:TlpA family protein disulfide reductase n=1 Tax=Flavobacterium sp. ACN2 TaxID=1975676 RepID=UPI000BB3A2AC|nr:TlpA disulfide reductase family protein [Flavobacterium sp. ACN2]PBI90786.1 Thiol-disulfide oxidoreductase ResA [Flavobacterium sp. ACN2]
MKILKSSFIVLFVLLSNFTHAQSDEEIEKMIVELHKPTKKIRDSIIKLQKEVNSKIEIEQDSIIKEQLKLRYDTLENANDENAIEELKLDFVFAKKHLNSLAALQLVRMNVNRFIGMNFYDTYEEVFQNFTPEIRNSEKGRQMAENLQYFKQSKVGSAAPNFTLQDSNGKVISLDEFKGKQYVLIDFWASWCGPCREELPYIKELYKKYHQQGFEIISVAKDDKPDLWKKAIAKEKIENWRHIFTSEDNRTIIKDYFVNGIPHKILIDKNGVIIGKWKGSGENNKHDLQQLLKSIFEAK